MSLSLRDWGWGFKPAAVRCMGVQISVHNHVLNLLWILKVRRRGYEAALVSIFSLCSTNMKQISISIDQKLVPELSNCWKEQCLLYMLANFGGNWSSLKRIIFESKCSSWRIGVESHRSLSPIKYSVATASTKRKFSENSNWTKEEQKRNKRRTQTTS